MKKNIGIIGRNFGEVIKSEAAVDYNVIWHIGTDAKLESLLMPDLVYIASSLESHFELAEFFLNKKTPVILEKTPCVNKEAVKKLIKLANENNVYIYFSDLIKFKAEIFNFDNDQILIKWTKKSTSDEWICFRLAFHYIYLVTLKVEKKIKLNKINISKDFAEIELSIGNKKY